MKQHIGIFLVLLCVEVLGGDVETVDGIPCNYEAVDGVLLTDDDRLENDEARVVGKDGVDYLVFCENDCVTIVGCENPSKVDLAIPAVIGGRVVTRIGEQAFQYCRDIISVTIPSSVMSIGDWAFCGCSGLVSVTIPSGVQTIGFGAFSSCGLTNLTIHSGKTRIGEQAFRDCSSLASVTLPETVMIGNMAFHGCVGLADPNGLVVVNNVLYDGFGSNVDIPSGVTRISGYAFDWRNIKGSLKIPSSVTSIGECAFLSPSREGIGSVYVDDLKQFASIEFEDKYSNPVTFAKEFYVAGELVTGTCTVTYVADDGGWFEDADSEYGFANQKTVEVEIGKGVLWPPEFRYGGEFGRKIVGWEGENCVISDVVVHPIYGTPSLEEVLYKSGLEVACAYDHFYYDTTEGTIHTEGAIGFSDEWRVFELFNGGNLYITAVADDGAGHVICKKSRKVTMSYEDNPYYKVNIDGTWNFSFKDAQRKVRGISVYIESPSYPGPGDSSTYICNQYEPAYQVTFDLGNKCSQVSNVDLVQYVEEGGHAVVPSVRTEKGWKWLGWSADVTQEISETTKFEAICEPIVYSIDYTNTKGTANPNPITYTVTNEIVFAALPNTDEYWFTGWEPAKIDVGTTGDLVVEALWIRVTNDVEWVAGDYGRIVSGNDRQQVGYGETVAAPMVETDVGWRFVGWDGDVAQPINSNTIFTAVYEPIVYSVDYANTKGVDNPNPTTYTVTNEIVFAALSDTDEYWFRGWEPAKIEVGTMGDLVVTAKWDRIQGVAEAAGDQNREWVSSGDADWFVAWNDEKGKYVVRSGEIGNSQTSVLETVVMNGGTVSFAVATSCEPSYRGKIRTDGLSFLVDDNEVLWLDGESGWTNVLWSVTGDGAHRLQWKYGKDIEGASGRDCAFLSEFTFYHEVVVSFSGGDATEGDAPGPIFSYNGAEITLPPLGTLRNPRHAFVGWSDGETVYQPGDRFLLGDVAPVFTAQWAAKRLSAPVISVPPFYTMEKTTVTISAEAGSEVRYTLDGSDPTMASVAYAGPFEIAGSMTVRAAAFREDWFDSPVVSATTVRAPWTYGECLNSETLNFTSEGAGAWVRDLSVTHDEVAALCSGAIGNNATSRLELVVVGGGELTFWWKASTEVYRGIPMDSGVLVVDGEDVADVYGEADWARKAVVLSGGGLHTIRWEFRKDEEDDPLMVGDDCVWLDEVKWTSFGPSVVNDAGATVTGDAETGFVVKPSVGNTAVEVTIPQGVDAAKVTVEVSVKVASVKPNGAKVKIINAGADITEFLNVPVADRNGVVDLTKVTVKEEIVKEAMDVEKGAKIDLDAANPTLITPTTRVGLFYQLREGTTLDGMSNGGSTIGDGNPWKPEIKVKGGNSAFYSIGVSKGE